MDKKKRLLIFVSLILVGGFLTTSLVSYFIARSSLRDQITDNALPLTSDNVYSEIQRDLLKPIFISSLMAHDTFLRDWVIGGEKNANEITRYLKEVMTKYNTFTSFLVSENTRIYYHADGILKTVKEDEERDTWYFRVRKMAPDYEINVDPDLANQDALTIFINHKVYDYDGKYIGAIGVGLTIRAVLDLIEEYHEKYNSNIYFVDAQGSVVLRSTSHSDTADDIHKIEGVSELADQILASSDNQFRYKRNGQLAHLHTRFVPELNWYLLVEQMEGTAVGSIYDTLLLNLFLCSLVTGVVIVLTTLTINAFQRTNQQQQEEIVKQHDELLEKNASLENALIKVKMLSGMLPICSSCKKIRDDKGYWQQIENYIQAHSEADFTHGICPDCAHKLYPEYIKLIQKDAPSDSTE